jgi:hypothetical protein
MGRRGDSESGAALLGLSAVRYWLSQVVVELARIEREVGRRPKRVKTRRCYPVLVRIGQTILRRRRRQATQWKCAADRGYRIGHPGPLLVRKCVADVAIGRITTLRKHTNLVIEHVAEGKCVETGARTWGRRLVGTSLCGTEHGVKLVVGQRQGIHGACSLHIWLRASVLVLRQSSKS